jgi:CrcB protein
MNPPSFPAASLTVAAGGALGSWLRFLVARALGGLAMPGTLPWATLAVNLVGSFAMGLLAGWLARLGAQAEPWRLLLGVGVLGGFTTFSAFSLETVSLIERGAAGAAATYVLISLVAGIGGLFAGLALARSIA